MENNGWIEASKSPIAAGIEPDTTILVWHVYQGVLAVPCGRISSNRFYTHWQPIRDSEWITSEDRTPTKTDADAQNCVISRNRFDEIGMTGWHRFVEDHTLLRWQTPPKPPDNYRELRIKA